MTGTTLASPDTANLSAPGPARRHPEHWLLALVPVAVAWWGCSQYGVAQRDLAAFAAYVVLVLAFPGTVLWTLVRGSRLGTPSWLVDLSMGTVVGLLAEAPLYLVCRALGEPRLLWAWPVAIGALLLGLTLSRREGPGQWAARLRRTPLRPFHAWVLALLMIYVLLAFDQRGRGISSLAPLALRTAYPDESFHLSLIGELRHHGPSQMPFVAGTPLDYHWLVYDHLASASWLTGIAPVVLLKILAPVLVFTVGALAASAGAVLLTGRPWTAPATAATLAFTGSLDVYGWSAGNAPWGGPGAFNPSLLLLSPTYTYSATLAVVPLVTGLLWLRRDRTDWALLVLFAASVVPVAGAKSTTLPVLGAGLLGVSALQWVLQRRLPVRPLVLLALTGVGFMVAKVVFYGPGARSLTFSPFAFLRDAAVAQGVAPDPGSVPWSYLLVMAAVWLLVKLAAGAGLVGLLVRSGWRDPVTQMLLGTVAAGFGAAMLLDHPASSQMYFMNAVHVPLALASVLGIARLVREHERAGASVAAAAALLGLLAGLLVPLGFSTRGPVADYRSTFLVPLLVFTVVVALVALAAHVAARRVGARGVSVPMIAAVMVLAACSTPAIATTGRILSGQHEDAALPKSSVPSIGPGGLQAARWVQRHTSPDDLLAANTHCRLQPVENCDRRHFWISGYAERRVLVEGWAYVSPQSVGLPSNDITNSYSFPFWDPARLTANNRAFTDPTRATLRVLSQQYGVTWLFVDEAYPHDERGLNRLADRVFHDGRYTVYRLRD